jgi:dTMP kinase
MKKRGLFISIEGVEGVGKSTNISLIQEMLGAAKIDYVTTREPGGTPIAEKIRELLLDKQNVEMTNRAELLLVFAARAQHIQELIEPTLASGSWVITDRFTDSTYAYQGGGRGAATAEIKGIEQFAIRSFQPDLTILLDLATEIGLERAGKRGELDRFESETAEFFEQVRSTFLSRAAQFPDRFRVIDAGCSLGDVQQAIRNQLQPVIDEWRAA